MPTYPFNPTLSTNEVFRGDDQTRFLTNDLDAIEADISDLETGKAAANHTHSEYAAATHTHSGYASTDHTHSEYSPVSHNHDTDYVDKALQFTADDGDAEYIIRTTDNISILTKIDQMSAGIHTAYSQAAVTDNPKTIGAWRMLIHKTTTTNGWVIAFGSLGSVYANYRDTTSWKGWRALYNVGSNVLWSGTLYPNANHTITPTKKLSECKNGWMLLWCDYDPDSSAANDADFVTTMIPKHRYDGNVWDGKNFLCEVPRFYGSDAADTSTEKRILKTLAIYDDKIVGNVINNQGDRNDVVLRAVYEF